jgi:hypothetical protein
MRTSSWCAARTVPEQVVARNRSPEFHFRAARGLTDVGADLIICAACGVRVGPWNEGREDDMRGVRAMRIGDVSLFPIGTLVLSGAILATPGMAQQPSSPPPRPQSPQTISVQVPAPSEPPLPAGPPPDLDLVFTAQVAGWLEPCG